MKIDHAKIELKSSWKVYAILLFFFRFNKNKLNKAGSIVYEIIITESIPIMDKAAMDFNAGCWAKIKTPIPVMVVTPERKIDVL